MLDFLSATEMTRDPMFSYNPDLHGQKVCPLTTGQVATGYGEVAWDGCNHSGQVVPAACISIVWRPKKWN